jgi:Reverse transcriptase (RNA-dependent DNA polymerase)
MVFMEQAQGFIDSNYPDHVRLLHKSLYGLRQAPRAWFQKLSTTSIHFGFKSSCYDPSLFLAHHEGHILLVLIYVDDIIVTGSSSHQVQQCIVRLSAAFSIRDLGDLNFFLGIEATFTSDGLYLTRSKYLTDLLKRANMMTCKTCLSPMTFGSILTKEGSSPCSNPTLYHGIVGGLRYATLTRPDIIFFVNKVSQFMHQPTEDNWTVVKRILRYIAGTLDYGLKFYKNSQLQIHSYSDADWAGNFDDRRSTFRFCVYLDRNFVS